MKGVSSKDTFHVAKTVVDLSIFSQLPFFKNYFLKLLQKLKKPTHLALIRLAKKKKKSKKGRQIAWIGETRYNDVAMNDMAPPRQQPSYRRGQVKP